MGLGGAAEGGATFLALLWIGAAVLIGVALLWGVRAGTGRWRPAVLAVLAWTAALAVFPVLSYFTDASKEQRRASHLREVVSAAAGVSSRPAYGDLQSGPCVRDDREVPNGSWDAVGTGDAGSPDVLARFEAGLAREGFQTSRGQTGKDDYPYRIEEEYVHGTRGRASVLVEQAYYDLGTGRFFLRVEDGCGEVRPPR